MPQVAEQTSLESPNSTTADERAARLNVVADDANPNATAMPARALLGHNTRGARWVHLTVQNESATASYSLWLWDPVAELWGLDTRLGTDGIAAAAGDSSNPDRSIVEIVGTPRVFVQFTLVTGTHNAWISGVKELV